MNLLRQPVLWLAMLLAGCGGGDSAQQAVAVGSTLSGSSAASAAAEAAAPAPSLGGSTSAAPTLSPGGASSGAPPSLGSATPAFVGSTPTTVATTTGAAAAPAVAPAPAAVTPPVTTAPAMPSPAALPPGTVIPGAFSFSLASAAKTSAGVYQADGTLVRTLWSGEALPAGPHTRRWDGLLDDGSPAPTGPAYNIKVLSGNVRYEWEGARIGNTSTALTGATKHRLFEPIRGIAISGNTAYVAGGYNEAWPAQYKFNLATPQEKTWVGAHGATDLGTDFVATDGINVYWAGYDPLEQKNKGKLETLVFATRLSDDQQVAFGANGTPASMEWGHIYPSTLSYLQTGIDASPFISGLAVQKSRPYLFVARRWMNQLQVLDKTTGAVVQVLSLSSPAAMAVDPADNLWLSNGSTVTRYTVNSNGTLTPSGLALAGAANVGAIAISPDGAVVLTTDLSTQQVKAYSAATAAALWTLGQSGGYFSDATVTNDKFYFRDVNGVQHTYLAYSPDGSFWVGDPGNFRTLHFAANRSVIETIMTMPNTYSTMVDPNNPKRLFAGYLEFRIDYAKPLGANNGSWTLRKNWGANIDNTHYNVFEKMQFVSTMKNGRTYGNLRSTANNVHPGYPLHELVEGGTIRYTGINFPQRTFIIKDGSKVWNPGAILGMPAEVITYPLTGFDPAHNPIWSATPDSTTASPPVTGTDPVPWEGFRTEMFSASGNVIYFDYNKEEWGHGAGYHLGAIKRGTNRWLWRTARSLGKGYSGPFPQDGAFDVANGVIYPGGSAVLSGDHIFWGYHGEFWKQSQTNKWNHVDARTGLFVNQFGIQNIDFPGIEAPPGGAGNVLMGSATTVDGATYLYHGDEGINNGIHRWKITGLDTVKVQQAIYPSSETPASEEGIDLLAGLPHGTTLANNTAGWTRSPAADITTNLESDYFTVSTGVKTADRFQPTDVYVLYRQNSATFNVSRDLGSNVNLASWKIKGTVSFEGSTPTQAQFKGGAVLEVLDDRGKVLARLDVRQSVTSGTDIVGNDKTLAHGAEQPMRTVFSRMQPFEISADANAYSFTYAAYPMAMTSVQPDPLGNWRNPKTLRMTFFTHNSSDNYYRTMDLSNLRFVPIAR